MVKTIQINLSNKLTYTLTLIGILIVFAWGVIAYGGSQPSVVGHSAGEIEEADPTVQENVKDGVSWSELSGIPAGFADNVDNEGKYGYACSAYQCKVHCYAVHGSPWVDVTHTFVPSASYTICLQYPDPFAVGGSYTVHIRSKTGGSYRCNCG